MQRGLRCEERHVFFGGGRGGGEGIWEVKVFYRSLKKNFSEIGGDDGNGA